MQKNKLEVLQEVDKGKKKCDVAKKCSMPLVVFSFLKDSNKKITFFHIDHSWNCAVVGKLEDISKATHY